MVRCFSCGSTYLLEVETGLYKCQMCGQLNEERRSGQVLPRRMEVYPRIEQVREAAKEGVYEMVQSVPSESGVSSEMRLFINRVSEALTPLKGYEGDRGFVVRALSVRSKFKKELIAVLEGKRKFQEWYDVTRTSLGMREDQMDEIIYSALEGLTEPDAVNMRNNFEHKLMGRLVR